MGSADRHSIKNEFCVRCQGHQTRHKNERNKCNMSKFRNGGKQKCCFFYSLIWNRGYMKEIKIVIRWENLWCMLAFQALCGRHNVNIREKKKEKSNQWWRNNKMDMSVFFLLLFLPRGPQLRSDTWLSNSMNSGESSSVASVRDYQHIHSPTHNNATTSHALTATVPQDSQVGLIWVSEVWYYYFVPIHLIFYPFF